MHVRKFRWLQVMVKQQLVEGLLWRFYNTANPKNDRKLRSNKPKQYRKLRSNHVFLKDLRGKIERLKPYYSSKVIKCKQWRSVDPTLCVSFISKDTESRRFSQHSIQNLLLTDVLLRMIREMCLDSIFWNFIKLMIQIMLWKMRHQISIESVCGALCVH